MEQPKFEKKVFKAAIINTDEIVKAQSRDIGDAHMTESKEDRSKNIFTRTIKRIWKHNLAQEWYRNREISRAKKAIMESGNLYAGEKDFDPDQSGQTTLSDTASKEAMEAIVERFTSKYSDEMLKEEERDSRQVVTEGLLNADIKELIKLYAGSKMPDKDFEEEKKRILSVHDESYASPKSLHIDNLLTIAKEVKDSVNQGFKIEELDFDVEITLGTAREVLDTEAHLNSFDRCVEKMQNSKIGKYVANEGVLAVVAGLWDVGRNVVTKSTSSTFAKVATFGGAAVVAGVLSGVKERSRVTRERAQHQRESAKGMEFKGKDMKRREQMEKNSYATKKSTIILQGLTADLAKVHEGAMSKDDLNALMGRLADVEARLALGREQKIDLITYDKSNTMNKDYNTMNDLRGELKELLRTDEQAAMILADDFKQDFDGHLAHLVGVQRDMLLNNEDYGVKAKDKVFTKMRNARAWQAGITTTVIGAGIGAAFQEGKALLSDGQDSVFEGFFKDKSNLQTHGTALEALRRSITGDHTMMPHDHLFETIQIKSPDTDLYTHIKVPEGVTIVQNPADGTFNVVRGGDILAENVPFSTDPDGTLSDETEKALAKNGITNDFLWTGEKTSIPTHESIEDYVKNHSEGMKQVHRDIFYDNDTNIFDKGELDLKWGAGGTGINAAGNYEFDVSDMTADGSSHDGIKPNVPELIREGKLKMQFSFSQTTQHQVFDVEIGPNGKAVIDADSELGKLMFEKDANGHAVFTGKFAEVVQAKGTAPDGGEIVDVFATHTGDGKKFIDTIVDTDTKMANVVLHIPAENTYDVPYVVPIGARRPLERGEYKKNVEVVANRPKGIDRELNDDPDLVVPVTPGQPQPIRDTVFNPDVSENMQYNPNDVESFGITTEEMIPKEADHIYAFAGLNRAEIEAQLKGVGKHQNPEILIFENDVAKRPVNLKLIEDMKKWLKKKNPQATFRYIALPQNVTKLNLKEMEVYADRRYKNILKNSTEVEDKVKAKSKLVAYKPLGPITRGELVKFMENDAMVSPARFRDIEKKLEIGEKLNDDEKMMYKLHVETVEIKKTAKKTPKKKK